MKIAYVFHHDAANPAVQSGRPAALLHELARQNHEVERIFPLAAQPSNAEFAKKVGYRLLRKHHRHDRHPEYLDALASQFNARTGGRTFDLIFSPGSEVVSHLPAHLPVAYCADATFGNLVDYYWDFTGLSEEYLHQGFAQEKAALERALLAVYPSEWAARSAIEQHGADPARVAVIPFGANLGGDNRRAGIMAAIARRPADTIRLLFVGRHWQRKGGDLVIATAMCLIAHGHRVTVDVVGCDVPAEYRSAAWIRAHGLLRQTEPAEMLALRQLYAAAHFLFVPSRAEAYGLTFTEANAFGVPSIATNTGGIPAVVRNGHNGLLLPLSAQSSHYADAIVAAFSDPRRYEAMCHRAFAEFEDRLNWPAFTRKFIDLAQERIATLHAAPAA
ncbi:MAG: glycosyltransferase family 4 protein [Lacunisphaera sp.]